MNHRHLYLLTGALAASAVVAQEANRLQSADCRKALDLLQTQETAAVAASRADTQLAGREPRPVRVELEKARRDAATACLGGRADSPAPAGRSAQAPVTVAPIRIAPAPPPQLPAGAAPPLLKKIEPPVRVTDCDLVSCWASDGSRLQRAGPNLLGPRGLCIVQGPLLHCP